MADLCVTMHDASTVIIDEKALPYVLTERYEDARGPVRLDSGPHLYWLNPAHVAGIRSVSVAP